MYPLGAVLWLMAAPTAVSAGDSPAPARTVELLGRIGRASGASFSPDGRHIALVSDLGGLPQVWIVSADGGYLILLMF